ncbi:MAG: hypothetical protein R3B90_17850 [Planctomycetaceae bacterium]
MLFRKATDAQTAVEAGLLALDSELSEWRQQFDATQQLADLLDDQRRILDASEVLGREPSHASLTRLTDQQRADLLTQADRQSRLATHFDRISRHWNVATEQAGDGAIPLSHSRLAAIRQHLDAEWLLSRMREAGQQLSENRVGAAVATQQDVVTRLEQALQSTADVTRADALTRLAAIQQAREQVESLYQRQAGLVTQLDAIRPLSAEPNPDPQLQILAKEHRDLADRTLQLAAELQRQALSSPAQSASRAASRMRDAEQALNERQADASSRAQADALADLQQLARELESARQQGEQDRAREQLVALRTRLESLLLVAEEVRGATTMLANQAAEPPRWNRVQLRELQQSAERQQQLADSTRELLPALAGLEVVRRVVNRVSQDMEAAAQRLAERRADAETLALQSASVAALQTLLQSLQPEPAAEPSATAADQAATSQDAATDSAAFAVQWRLLRTLQASLLERTTNLRADDAPGLTAEQIQALTHEQAELAEQAQRLLLQMQQQGAANPDASAPTDEIDRANPQTPLKPSRGVQSLDIN